jgi:peptidoglycan hydrolase-like protein with peptidoglycan-binding domain
MSKISETSVDRFSYRNNTSDLYNLDKLLGRTGNSKNPDVHSGNPNAYQLKLVYDRSSYLRQSLNNKENLGIGGAERLSANSSPQELLKDPRVRAMLDTIGYAEGTRENYGRVVFGTVLGPSDRNAPYDRSKVGKRNVVVNDFEQHPNLAVRWANGQPPSSAAGRYQFLYSTWKGSPRSQDLAAIKLMQRRGMIEPLLRGDFTGAIHKGAPEWASLPTSKGGSYYGGQGAKNIGDLRDVYSKSLRRYQDTQAPPPQPAPTKPNQNSPDTLKKGQHGRSVEVLQDKLINLGLMTKAQKNTGPGIFGPRTEAAVKNFQRGIGIEPSGELGPTTRRMMNQILSGDIKKGAEGGVVRHIQEKLVSLGYMTRAQVNTGPGIFGSKTDAALKRFQSQHGLADDGVFGPKTFKALRNASPRRSQPNQPNQPSKPPTDGNAPEYKRWNVYSTGDRPARQADGYEDLQTHHGPNSQWTNYVSRNVKLNHNLQKHDIVLTRTGQSNFGQAVPSPLQGKVLFAGNENDGYGNKVVVKNTRTGQIMSVNHLQSINVRSGESVAYGQKLGGQGDTGNSSGAHIHINADPSVIKRWVADLADGRFDGVRRRFDVGSRP